MSRWRRRRRRLPPDAQNRQWHPSPVRMHRPANGRVRGLGLVCSWSAGWAAEGSLGRTSGRDTARRLAGGLARGSANGLSSRSILEAASLVLPLCLAKVAARCAQDMQVCAMQDRRIRPPARDNVCRRRVAQPPATRQHAPALTSSRTFAQSCVWSCARRAGARVHPARLVSAGTIGLLARTRPTASSRLNRYVSGGNNQP